MSYPQENLPLVEVNSSGEPIGIYRGGKPVDGVSYATEKEVVAMARSGKYPEFGYLAVREGLEVDGELKAGGMISPVPFDHMTDDEKSVYEMQTVKRGKNRGMTLKEVREAREKEEAEQADSGNNGNNGNGRG